MSSSATDTVPGPEGVTGSALSVQDIQDLLQRGPSDRATGAQLLTDVLFTLQQLWTSSSESLDIAAQKLGDASRTASWRLPLGDSGILQFFLDALSHSPIRHSLKLQALRIIGNSCADTNENRARVVASGRLPILVAQLADDQVLPFVIQVLFNFNVDYEPSQVACSEAGLSSQLVELLASPRFADFNHLLNMVAGTLELVVTQQIESNNANPQTPAILLKTAFDPLITTDPADTLLLASVGLSYLSFQNLQENFVTSGSVPILLSSFYDLTTRLGQDNLQGDDGEDLTPRLQQVRSSFMQILADICYLPSFTTTYTFDSPVFHSLLGWLQPSANASLNAAACLCFGNIARSDESSLTLVKSYNIHTDIIALVKNHLQSLPEPPQDALLLHSALSLLKNLSIPQPSKPLLSPLLAPSLLPAIWNLDPNVSIQVPHLQFVSVSLTRLLVTSTPANVRLLCARDPSSPGQTLLHRLLALFGKADPQSAAHTRMEAARAVLAVTRALHTNATPPLDLEEWGSKDESAVGEHDSSSTVDESAAGKMRERFYAAHDGLPDILAFLLTQDKFPVLRSEAWFVLALMSRSAEGAAVVIKVLDVPGAWDRLLETVKGQGDDDTEAGKKEDSVEEMMGLVSAETFAEGGAAGGGQGQQQQQQRGDMTRVDRENAVVLVSELVKNGGEGMSGEWKEKLEAVFKEGGQLVVGEREA